MRKIGTFYFGNIIKLSMFLLILSSCRDQDDGDELPVSSEGGMINLHLSSLPWEQDSILGVYAVVKDIWIYGEGNYTSLFGEEKPRFYNLMDSGMYLLSTRLDTGVYTELKLELELKAKNLTGRSYSSGKGGQSLPPGFLEFTDNTLEVFYSPEKVFYSVANDSIQVKEGDSLTVLMEVDLGASLRLDTLKEKVTVCHQVSRHKRETITIDRSELSYHLSHGDKVGRCSDGNGRTEHEDKDKDKKDKDKDDCRGDCDDRNQPAVRYYFDLKYSLVVPYGTIEGDYPNSRAREAQVLAYRAGTFDLSEIERDFSNAIGRSTITGTGTFSMSIIPGKHDVYGIEVDRRGSYEVVYQALDIDVFPRQESTVFLE